MYKQTLTVDEAERIVSIVERIMTAPKLPYGYRFSELQGYSRIDVAHAFMINIAQVYRDGRNHPDFESEISTFVNAMDSSLVHIATTGIPDSELNDVRNNTDFSTLIGIASKWSLLPMTGKGDANPSLLIEREYFGNLEMPSSIAKYCSEVLQPRDPEYWKKLYDHIGLEFPARRFETQSSSALKQTSKKSSGCMVILLILALFGA